MSGDIDPSRGQVSLDAGKRMALLRQNHYAFDDVTVLDTVMMGHDKLLKVMKAKDAIYEKPDFSEADGIEASHLEAEFAEILFGKMVVKGTRVPAELILEKLALGNTLQELIEAYPRITQQDILACLSYASENAKHEKTLAVDV